MGDKRLVCSFCGYEFSDESPICPHCARPALYVNVIRAEKKEERDALRDRYDRALLDAQSRHCETEFRDFEQAVFSASAAIARRSFVVEALVDSDSEIYGTFYLKCVAGIRLPEGSEWDELRNITDSKLFGEGKKEIRFAALTLDELGASGYGGWQLHLREDMIAHRATVFHTNSVLFPDRFEGIMPRLGFPPGFRATWAERGILCAAKCAPQIHSGTKPDEYGKILLSAHADSRSEEFVEIHIWGPVTIRTVDRIVAPKQDIKGVRRKKLESDLRRYGVSLKVI